MPHSNNLNTPTRRNLLAAALALPVVPLLPALAATTPAPPPKRRLRKHPALAAPYGTGHQYSSARAVYSASGVRYYDAAGTLRLALGVF